MKPSIVLTSLALFAFLLSSCHSSKNAVIGAPNSQSKKETLKELDHFPQAKPGFERFVIFPEPKNAMDAEAGYQIELIPGKMMKIDCNHHFLHGMLSEKNLEGFGYKYYEFSSDGNVGSTLMGCPDNTLKDAFVTGETKMVRYNSRLPLVVYVPKGFELRYKIWSAGVLQNASH